MNFDGTLERIRARAEDPEYQRAQAQKQAEAEASLIRRRHSELAATGIPVRFLEVVSGQLEATDATAATAELGGGLLVLSGTPGCGKTVAACAWLRERIFTEGVVDAFGGYKGKRAPLFVTSARLSRWDRYNHEAMDNLLKADRLVIDDLGAEYADKNGNFGAILDELVSDRHANRRPMILTTNLDAAAFKARYDERIADRIRECGKFVSLTGASMRKRIASAE